MSLYQLFSDCLHIPYIREGDVNYAFKREGEVLTLFFEDSQGEADWRRNLDFPARAYQRMGKTVWYAHRGFLEAWREVEGVLAPVIADKSIRRIVTVGYSHGAAIAVLCHEYIWYHRPELRQALEGWGFGCPRVLWGFMGRDLKARWEYFTVVRNPDDIVTHLPPMVLGYTHVGRMLELSPRGSYSATAAHEAENILRELARYEQESVKSPTE